MYMYHTNAAVYSAKDGWLSLNGKGVCPWMLHYKGTYRIQVTATCTCIVMYMYFNNVP